MQRALLYSWVIPSHEPSLGQIVDRDAWFLAEGEQRGPDDEESPMPVYLRLGRNDRGRLICTALIIGDLPEDRMALREVNAARLRAVHIPELIAAAAKTGDLPDEYGQAVRELLSNLPDLIAGPRSPRGYDDDHFRGVAAAYRHALDRSPSAPTKWLADQYKVSMPTARRWVQRARDRGFLGPSIPGKSGERTEPPVQQATKTRSQQRNSKRGKR